MRRWHTLNANLFFHDKPLPIPSSFLVDQYGRLAIVYRGAVGTAQLIADTELIHTSDAQRITTALYPLGGRSAIGILPINGLGFSRAYLEGGYFEDARREILDFIQQRTRGGSSVSSADTARAQLSAAYDQLARIEQARRQPAAAIEAYRQSLRHDPGALRSRVGLARLLWQAGQRRDAEDTLRPAEVNADDSLATHRLLARTRAEWGQPARAIPHFEKCLALDPQQQVLRLELAVALRAVDRAVDAVAQYRRLLQENPGSTQAANNLAWLLATAADPSLRNGPEAVRLAQQICADTQYQQPALVDTLAAALAEAGRFPEAIATAQRAIQAAEAHRQSTLARQIRRRLARYEQQLPFHDAFDSNLTAP
jgi:tetratricopeptide (TPR) repeat protein